MTSADPPRDGLVEQLEWDSRFWGFPVVRMHAESADGLSVADRSCEASGVAVAYLAVSPARLETVTAAARRGFEVVDLRMLLSHTPSGRHDAGTEVRAATADDLPVLEDIASRVYRGVTRFYADLRFPRARCDDLYRTWIRNSVNGWADQVLVADRGAGPIGFVTGHVDTSNSVSRVGLLGVMPEHNRTGVGRSLVDAFVAHSVQLGTGEQHFPTQASNDRMIRLLADRRWTVRDVSVWLHKWYGASGSEDTRH